MTFAGETFSATSAEYFSLKQQLESECFAPEAPGEAPRYYSQLPQEQRARLLRERLKKYCQRVSAPCPPDDAATPHCSSNTMHDP